MKKFLALLLVAVMVLGLVACNKTDDNDGKKEYTYRSYSTALGTNWNPHSWEMNADDAILQYLSTPLVTMQILSSEEETWQWVYVAATSIEDVTKDHRDDLTKYGSDLRDVPLEEIDSQYVYEIKLNPDMKWENGTPINADTYIYSMKQLLDPKMRNYRSNLYWGGESAVAGGRAYYEGGAPIYTAVVPAYETEGDYSYDWKAAMDAGKLYISTSTTEMTLAPYTLAELINTYGDPKGPGAAPLAALSKAANAYGYTKVTAENLEDVKTLIANAILPFGLDWTKMSEEEQTQMMMEALFHFDDTYNEVLDYDATVGCYKVDDYTIRYVMDVAQDIDNFRISCASNWLVYEPLYEAGKDTTGELVTTNYNSSKETTMSYGPYKIHSLQKDKEIVFVQNENYYTFTKNEDGSLSAVTPYLVDGKNVPQYQATKIKIEKLTDQAAKQAFLKGELDDWAPPADEMTQYTASDRMYQVDESYTQRLFFHTNLDALKTMDASGGNQNSVVMSNHNFRKAMSLAIDRADYVLATAGYKPAFGLLNRAYYYDFFNDPTSRYRDSDPAMQAICDMYGIKYGEGTPYATLKDAYNSVTGYNLTEAKELMKTACKELVEAGLYKEGDPIKIRMAWSKPALDSVAEAQIAKLNEYINAAVEGTGFGKIELEGVGSLEDRFGDVVNGTYAIGYGAWGGATLYPYRTLSVYVDPEQAGTIHESGCWDPTTTNLTLTVNGKEITKPWSWWGTALQADPELSAMPNPEKLKVLSVLETRLLDYYYMIPLASTCSASLMGYKIDYYTNVYNDAYGFGGLELLHFNYSDAEWEEYLKTTGGELSYQ